MSPQFLFSSGGQRKPRFWQRLLLPSCNRLAGVGSRLGPLDLFPQCSRGQKEHGCLCRCWESASLAQGVKLPLIELDPFGPETAFHGNSVCVICLVVSDSLQPHRLQPTRPLSPCGTHQARTLEPVAISFSKRNYQFSSVA